jgi:hypothetical protein
MDDHERRLQIAVIEKTISTLEEHLRQLESEVAETNTKLKTAMNDLYKLRLQRPK